MTVKKVAIILIWSVASIVLPILWNFNLTLGIKIISGSISRLMFITLLCGIVLWKISAIWIARWQARIAIHQPWGFILFFIPALCSAALLLLIVTLLEPAIAVAMKSNMGLLARIEMYIDLLPLWGAENIKTFGAGHITFSASGLQDVKFVPIQLVTRFPYMLILFYLTVYVRSLNRRWKTPR